MTRSLLLAPLLALALVVPRAEAQGPCPPGRVLVGDVCCPPGYGLDPATRLCVPIRCPAGTVLQHGVCAAVDRGPSPFAPTGAVEYQGHPTWGLFVTGVIMFPAAYLITLLTTIAVDVGINGDGNDVPYAAIPLAGPFIMMTDPNDDDVDDYAGALIPVGVLQVAGAVLMVLGLAIESRSPVPRAEGVEIQPLVGLAGESAVVGATLRSDF